MKNVKKAEYILNEAEWISLRTYYRFTETEIKVLKMMFSGRKNDEIAKEINISYPTVRTHISHIVGKVRVDNRIELVIKIMIHLGKL